MQWFTWALIILFRPTNLSSQISSFCFADETFFYDWLEKADTHLQTDDNCVLTFRPVDKGSVWCTYSCNLITSYLNLQTKVTFQHMILDQIAKPCFFKFTEYSLLQCKIFPFTQKATFFQRTTDTTRVRIQHLDVILWMWWLDCMSVYSLVQI